MSFNLLTDWLHQLLGRKHARKALLDASRRGDSWTESQTQLRKYRRYRKIRNRMAVASRRVNRA